jgi:hypothetical protein
VDKRAKAYKEMEEKLGVKAAEIKSKIVGLRAQLGREMVKVRARKSGMALSEVYESNWIYWDRLQFLTKVMEYGVPYPPKLYKYNIINYFSYYYSEYFYYY